MKKLGIIIPIVFVLAACGNTGLAATEIATSEPVITSTAIPIIPTNTEVPPTSTSVPTATIEPTATPEGQIFRDDFDGQLQPGWRWENENPQKWSITNDGFLQIVGEDPTLLNGEKQSNLLWRDLPEGNYAIIVHLKAKLFANFQQAAIFLYEDPENYITINHGYCDFCKTGGEGIYMDYKVGGQLGTYAASFSGEEVYLKLESKDNVISGYYATSPDEWVRLGRFANIFQFKNVGIGVSNCGSESSSNSIVTGQYDYFAIMQP